MAFAKKPPGRRPDYHVSAMSGSDHKGRVGAAWRKADGSISLKLNAFVVLAAVNDLVITLFPNDDTATKAELPTDPVPFDGTNF